MIKHCNKICPDCSCYFVPCNILLFPSTIEVYQKNCNGAVWELCRQNFLLAAVWLGRVLSEDKPYTRTVILSDTFLWLSRENSSRSFAGAGAFIDEDLWDLCFQRPKFRNSHVTSENGAVDLESNGPCHNGILHPFNWWLLFRRGPARYEQEQILQGDWRAFLRSSYTMIREVACPPDWFAWKLKCIGQLKWHYFRSLASVKDVPASLFHLLFSHASPLL